MIFRSRSLVRALHCWMFLQGFHWYLCIMSLFLSCVTLWVGDLIIWNISDSWPNDRMTTKWISTISGCITSCLLNFTTCTLIVYSVMSTICVISSAFNPYATISNKIQQANLSLGACSFSFWWRNKPNKFTACNVLCAAVADCCGLLPVVFA